VPEPRVSLSSLDTLWFQVAGTVCNLACTHCLVSSSPTNRTHEPMGLAQVRELLAEAAALGVKDYYFTGGEPFLNPEMEAILEATLRVGPATVLTNGLLLPQDRCERLKRLAEGSPYSLDLRVSLDGLDAETNDRVRGEGVFAKVLAALRRLASVGLNPVLTVTEVWPCAGSKSGREGLIELLKENGVEKPRLKILPLFHIGAEAARGGTYESWQRLTACDAEGGCWAHLQCSNSRMATDQGVWVCPILVNEPGGRMGETLADALGDYPLTHPACWTCHAQGATCRT
jgi:uncharacterized Fe-S cluster-containing radical SAM superfamily protein